MTPKAQAVLDIMSRDGGITQLIATHYNIGDIRKEVNRLREAGVKVLTVKRKDAAGHNYTRWTLAKMSEQPIAVQLRSKLAA